MGWFRFNVMSAQMLDKISGLVAVHSLMATVGGPLAGLMAVCVGSHIMHLLGKR